MTRKARRNHPLPLQLVILNLYILSSTERLCSFACEGAGESKDPSQHNGHSHSGSTSRTANAVDRVGDSLSIIYYFLGLTSHVTSPIIVEGVEDE